MKIKEKEKSDHVSSKRDQYTIVLEDLLSQFKVFGESLFGFRKETLERLDKLEKNQEVTLEHLFRIDDRLNEIEKDLKEIKADIRRIDESKADKNNLEFLKNKVLKLETELKKAIEWQKNQQKSASLSN